MMSSGPHTLDSAISTLVPAVLRVLRKMKRWRWDAITGTTLSAAESGAVVLRQQLVLDPAAVALRLGIAVHPVAHGVLLLGREDEPVPPDGAEEREADRVEDGDRHDGRAE